MDAAVTLVNLEKRFGDFVAVNRVSLTVGTGEIFGFLGPNGAGKSTTIRMLCGLLTPSGGSGTVAGFDLAREPERIKENLGYMSQKFSLYEDLTVEENLDFYGGIYRVGARLAARKEWALAMAGLTDRRGMLTAHLPAGWRQQLALGCAVLHEPPLLFLDEPTSGVDPLTRRRFWNLIYELAERGTTVFVTTHSMDEAEYCDRLGLIYRGELIALGTPAELKRTALSGEVLEIAGPQPHEMLDALEKLPGVTEAMLFGRGIHLVAARIEPLQEAIRAALTAAGLAWERMERVTPSLEDVFVALIEAKDRDHLEAAVAG